MPVISVSSARPGMRLAAPARDVLGAVLYGPDEVLTDAAIRNLKAWGVRSISIESEEDAAAGSRLSGKDGAEELERESVALERMFAPHGGDERMERIREIAERQLRRRLG